MKSFKYEIGDVLYYAGCSKEFQEATPFTVGKRKVESSSVTLDGEVFNIEQLLYSSSPDVHAAVWYGESSLVREVSDA
jgi:hypothetical protein